MTKKSDANVNSARGKASTEEVLGNSGKTLAQSRVSRKWEEHRLALCALRERLSGHNNTLGAEAKEEMTNFSEHMADAGTDSYDRDWALAMVSSGQETLYEIDAALDRIESGTYGVCEITGQPIESERLKAIPWTRYSAEAQVELEDRGVVFRAHLGELGSWPSTTEEEEPAEPAESTAQAEKS
jgi:RNA polymerase-binding transcription factor DksA